MKITISSKAVSKRRRKECIAVNGKVRGGAEGSINTEKEEGMRRRQTMTVLHHHTSSTVVGNLSLIDTKPLPPKSYMR